MTRFMLSVVVVALAARGGAAGAQASQDRIPQAIQGGKVSALAGTVHPLARAEFDQGLVESSLVLHGMTLDFNRSAAQQAALNALLKAQQDPSSPSYHKWLTPEEFADSFGMSPADIAKATAWLESQGFTVNHVADSRNAITFTGTAALAEAAFHTQIHKYSVNGEMHFANATAVSLPSSLAATVTRIGGLNDFRLKPQYKRPLGGQTSGAKPEFTSGLSGGHFIAPGDFAVIYDLNPLYTANYTGAGQTIGVIGQTDIVPADITAFRSAANLPAYGSTGGPTFTSYLIPGATDPGLLNATGDVQEASLDLEWSGGVAKNANIVFVISGDVFTSLQYAIANQINGLQIPILTLSYAGCESQQGTATIASLEASLQQANAQGQTVFNSSGDSGAAACDVSSTTTITSATQGLAVNYPASSAYVTGVGGSEFMGDGTAANPSTGADQYWSANGSNDVLTSALSYIPEMVWNDTAYDIANSGGLSAGGGGASLLFTKPSWQTGVPGIPSDGARDVPDVSLSASADHDPYLVCTQIILDSDPTQSNYVSSCSNGFRISDPGYKDDQGLVAYGGTSVSTPSFAGLMAVIEQKLGTPQGLGNINPPLYTLASSSSTYASAFHDITTGNNMVPCTANTANCPSSGSGELGYSAGTGYDQASGLGSVDGSALATAFTTVAVKAGTTVAIGVSPASPTVKEAVTLTATVTPNSGTTVPTGSVSFTVDGTFFTTVALTQGVATATTSFSTGGSHTVQASYSGDTNYYVSSTTSTISVSAGAGAAPTTTTLAANPATLALYGSLTLTATVQSTTAGTIAGTVTFTIGGTTVGTATVTPGASGTGTATLAVSSVTPALGFAAGANTVTATYGGDSDYAASSGTASVTVTNPGITMTVPNMTISSASPGNTGNSTITLTSTGGYAGTVNLTATAASLNAEYAISPTSVVLTSGGTGTAVISIQTVAASLKKGAGGNFRKAATTNRIAAGAVAFGCIFLLAIPGFRRRQRWPMLAALLLLGGLSASIGCGGGGSSGGSPAGTYTVTVTATDSSNTAITTSTNFTVTIQ